ncbi:DUF362 domain-containing protein [Candidatus Bathyarchaeota archaeon]|nr:DUF362 domain-containing protein [Candidatus Bathyarchaeota archaeon]
MSDKVNFGSILKYCVVIMVSVAVVKGEDPHEMLKKALGLIGAERLISRDDTVLIKPNYVVAKHPSTGITTDSRIIDGLIKFVKDLGVENIIVGEGGAGDTEKAFDVVGIREVVKRWGVKLVNLNNDNRINVRVPHALALREIGVAETALKSTCIINVPKLKVHHMALVTLCMKNLMGLILPKSIMHDRINEKIVDLASIFKDKVKLNVVDGLVGAEEDEVHGSPVRMDLIIAGEDMVAVDSVATAVMGIDPGKVKYLRLAEERGLGISNMDDIEVVGEDIERVKRRFKLPLAFRNILGMSGV